MLDGKPMSFLDRQFSIIPYRERNCCVLKIIFGGLLQISQVIICCLRHFLWYGASEFLICELQNPLILNTTAANKIDSEQFPNCLSGISTTQLELLFLSVRCNRPTYFQDCTISSMQLNNVNDKIKNIRCCLLMLTPFVKRWHIGNSTASYSMKPFEANIER